MAKGEPKDVLTATFKLNAFARVSLERAQQAIWDALGDIFVAKGQQITIKLEGVPPALLERLEDAKRVLGQHRGVNATVTIKHDEDIEPVEGATFWDQAERDEAERQKRLQEREAGTGRPSIYEVGPRGADDLADDPADSHFRKLLGDLDADGLGEEE